MVIRRLPVLVVALALVVAGLVLLLGGGTPEKTLTATFARTTSLYEGAKVKVLGVEVGRVETIEVVGTAVEVTMVYDADVELPDDVNALVVPPSIVGDRFVQLAPAYLGGPVLADGAELALEQTGVPLELDDTYRSLDELAVSLGPDGANADGALSRLISATAENLDGNGRRLNETLRAFAGALDTFAGSSDDIDATVRNLADLSATFAGNDAQVRDLVTTLAAVGGQLNGQRGDIVRSVQTLREALDLVGGFAKKHKKRFGRSVANLDAVTSILAGHADDLARLVDIAPVGLTSLVNIYVPKNWDPSRPDLTPVDGRTGNQALRAPLFDDLDAQLTFTLGAMCAQVPADQRAQIAALCDALGTSGATLGSLLTQLTGRGSGLPLSPSPQMLQQLMDGGTR